MGRRTLGAFRMGSNGVRLTACHGHGMQMKQKEEVAQVSFSAKLDGRRRTKHVPLEQSSVVTLHGTITCASPVSKKRI